MVVRAFGREAGEPAADFLLRQLGQLSGDADAVQEALIGRDRAAAPGLPLLFKE